MYRQYEPGQEDESELDAQPQQNMYNHMDYEDLQQLQGGRPMYCYPMPYDYPEQPMYQDQSEDGWWEIPMEMEPQMTRQPMGYGRPPRRRRRRRRPYFFYFYLPPFYYPRVPGRRYDDDYYRDDFQLEYDNDYNYNYDDDYGDYDDYDDDDDDDDYNDRYDRNW